MNVAAVAMFILASFTDELNTNTILLAAAIIGYVVKTIGEGRGWFKTSATLRVENTDLLRRNGELENSKDRLEEQVRMQGEKIVRLEEQVRALEKLDQSAVLQALRDHEIGASGRADRIVGAIEKLAPDFTLQRTRGTT